MPSIGDTLRKLREEKELPLRKVAAMLDIDTSLLSKIERNERQANRQQIVQLAKTYEIAEEESTKQILTVAEEKVKYIKKTNKK